MPETTRVAGSERSDGPEMHGPGLPVGQTRPPTKRRQVSSTGRRRGVVLLAVLIIVAMLSLGAYAFAQLMLVEAEATEMYGRGVMVRSLADSAVEAVLDLLANTDLLAEDGLSLYSYPEALQAVTVMPDDDPRWQGRFSVIALDSSGASVRFGLADESARINLRTLLAMPGDDLQKQDLLLSLPGMTPEIADAILDYIDDDDAPRLSGVESEYYLAQNPPYLTKNQPPDQLEELLLVRDVTPWLLFGEDVNRNGVLDPNENDGDASYPPDDADGTLNLGWAAYLTLYSRERNVAADGTPRIFLNNSDLTALYDELESALGESQARFIVAYRLYGPTQRPAGNEEEQLAGADQQNNQGSTSDSDSSSSGGSDSSSGEGRSGGQNSQAASSGGDTSRGGLDLSQSPSQQVESVFDLIGVQVQIPGQGDQQAQVLDSPFPDDPAAVPEYLPLLLDRLTTREQPVIEGRININQAPREVLLGLPGMDDAIVEGIVSNRSPAAVSSDPVDRTVAWLVTEGLVTLDQLRTLEPWITAGGSVYRTQVIGYFDSGGPVVRYEVVVDATELPPRLVYRRDLSAVGRGFDPAALNSQVPRF